MAAYVLHKIKYSIYTKNTALDTSVLYNVCEEVLKFTYKL